MNQNQLLIVRANGVWRSVITLSLLLGGFSICRADVERTQRVANLEARLVLETAPQSSDASEHAEVRLSGEVLKLEIIGPANLEVTVPDSLIRTKNWSLTRVKPAEVTQLPDGRRRWQGLFRVEPDRPGPANLQFAPMKVQTDFEVRTIEWPAIPVAVITSIQRVSPDELREAVPLQPYEGWEESSFRIPPWIAALVLTAGFATLGWLRYQRSLRLRQEQPEQWLRRRLTQLRAQNLDSPETIIRFYGDLADLLRHYIERRYALPAPTRTSREFLGDIRESTALTEQQRSLLEEFLNRCDLAKFAHEAPSGADCDAAVEMVIGFGKGSLSSD